MKFKMILEEGSKKLMLVAENPGEQAILASCASSRNPDATEECRSSVQWSDDRTPYRKALSLTVVI